MLHIGELSDVTVQPVGSGVGGTSGWLGVSSGDDEGWHQAESHGDSPTSTISDQYILTVVME